MSPSIRRMMHIVASAAVETVYPKVCAGCGMRGMWLCDVCETTVPMAILPISCPRCGMPKLGHRCACKDLDPCIMRARSAYVYDGWVANSVRTVKYHGEPARAEHLALAMLPALRQLGSVDGLVPVPLHPSREKRRGYNQAALLAEHLSRATGTPVLDVLRRTRKTISQTELSGSERKRNVEGVFALDPDWVPPAGRSYVLVDDVRTTCATLNACAEVLKAVRPFTIGVLTFAMDMQREDVELLRVYEAKMRP